MPTSSLNPEAITSPDGPKYNKDVNLLNQEDTEIVVPEEKVELDEEISKQEDEEIPEQQEEDDKKPESIYDRPAFGEIKAKYPEIVKDFPQLRDMFYRELEFTKLFPTVDDAKEAFDDNEAFVSLRESSLEGNAEPIIDAVNSQSKDTLISFSRSFLNTLSKKDPDAYEQTISPLLETVIRQFYKSSDDNEKNAALVLSNFLFGTTEIAEGKRTTVKKVDLPKKAEEGYNPVQINEVTTKANQALGVIINKDLDPNKVLTPFVRKQVVNETIQEIHNQLAQDKSHKAVMSSRWKRAKLNSYSEDDKTKIISTFLARAKSLIPSIRTKLTNDALGTQKKVSKDREEKITKSLSSKIVNGGPSNGRSESTPNLKTKNGKVDYRNMSDEDILNS